MVHMLSGLLQGVLEGSCKDCLKVHNLVVVLPLPVNMSFGACDDVVLAPSVDIIYLHLVAVMGQTAQQRTSLICAQHVQKNYHAFLEYPVAVMAILVPASACRDSLELLTFLCTTIWLAMVRGDSPVFRTKLCSVMLQLAACFSTLPQNWLNHT